MKILQFISIVVISGFIGYITNVLAIKALFRPLYPVQIPHTSIVFQGVIPKRREEIAKSIAQMVRSELLSEEDLIHRLVTEEDEQKFTEFLTGKIQGMVAEKTTILPKGIQGKLQVAIKDKVEKESVEIFDDVKDLVEDQIENRIDISALVEEKILALDLEKIEELTLQIAGRELRAIEWLGLIMGAGIGVVQGLLSIFVF